ncbi:MAG TPA: NADH-quinone oxidoreductase subunit C [Prolixibacteraceae bacterium]|nr:NADH-quinone oxidoreductase subunit C [Prolixibacteraceae bacterium]
MEKDQLTEFFRNRFPDAVIEQGNQYLTIKTDAAAMHPIAAVLKSDKELQFDYLFNLTGIDWSDRFSVVYHLESTVFGHEVVLKADILNREKPSVATVSDLWRTAEFHEREVYDLLGIEFVDHPDLRRLFLEDGAGFPLRKDFKDEINLIER